MRNDKHWDAFGQAVGAFVGIAAVVLAWLMIFAAPFALLAMLLGWTGGTGSAL